MGNVIISVSKNGYVHIERVKQDGNVRHEGLKELEGMEGINVKRIVIETEYRTIYINKEE